jgi:phospholipase/carboxylesterase
MCNFFYKSILIGNKAKKLVIFLHGYKSCIDDLLPSVEILKKELNDTLIIIPASDMVCERNPSKLQWYPLVDIDPLKKRRDPNTSTKDIINIYNKTGERISIVSKKINNFISSIQQQYKISNKNTYIMGFSQGAMLAIYTGLSRRYKVGGVFSFAGIICGKDKLETELTSTPSVYLFHGTRDLAVQYKTLVYTKSWLKKHNIDWEAIEYEGIEHKLIEDEMLDASNIINRKI